MPPFMPCIAHVVKIHSVIWSVAPSKTESLKCRTKVAIHSSDNVLLCQQQNAEHCDYNNLLSELLLSLSQCLHNLLFKTLHAHKQRCWNSNQYNRRYIATRLYLLGSWIAVLGFGTQDLHSVSLDLEECAPNSEYKKSRSGMQLIRRVSLPGSRSTGSE